MYPGPPGWGLCSGLTTHSCKPQVLQKRQQGILKTSRPWKKMGLQLQIEWSLGLKPDLSETHEPMAIISKRPPLLPERGTSGPCLMLQRPRKLLPKWRTKIWPSYESVRQGGRVWDSTEGTHWMGGTWTKDSQDHPPDQKTENQHRGYPVLCPNKWQ